MLEKRLITLFIGGFALVACAGGEPDATGFASLTNNTAQMTGGAESTGGSGSTGELTTSGSPPETSSGVEASSEPVTTGMTGSSGGSESSGGESSGGSTGAGEGGGCVDGTPTCPCYGNMTCNDGLVCEDDVCVPAMPVVCGDGIQGGTEECDAGAENGDTKLCKADCTLQKCGDGFVGPGEACDDGNAVDNDACSNACVPAACGDKGVQMGEACDDGNVEATDACIACKAAACGDTFVQAGVEECDDGNANNGDGCSAACKKEAPKCGGAFTTGWCPQAGTKEQFTRCEGVTNNGKTCNNPFIKYGNVENGVPASHPGNDFPKWCQQLGFAGYSGQVSYGNRPCDAPQGKLFGCTGYDENVWHWCDWQDGNWYNQALNYQACNDGAEITSITCQ
jgi:cysteine-rich repeat protein